MLQCPDCRTVLYCPGRRILAAPQLPALVGPGPPNPGWWAMTEAEQVLEFWFGDSLRPDADLRPHLARWFGRNAALDRSIGERFGLLITRASGGACNDWARTPRGRLALIVVLDQFTRNAFRDSPRAYCGDPLAVRLCLEGLRSGADRALRPVERLFFYLPLLHAEARRAQAHSLACFRRLAAESTGIQRRHFSEWLRTARRCRWVIACFGRYPHRNAVLGRRSTLAERGFLRAGRTVRRWRRARGS